MLCLSNKNKRWLWIFLFTLPFLLFGASLIDSFSSTPERKTQSKLCSICFLVNDCGARSLMEKMKDEPSDINILFDLISPSAARFGFTSEQFSALKVDSWGEPFHIDYTTNIAENLKMVVEFQNCFPFVIWSGGPNRIDERCLGDDIPWEPEPLWVRLDGR
jgi:hypothetical protein